jgi:hypothetical protein
MDPGEKSHQQVQLQTIFAHKPYALALLRYVLVFLWEVVQHSGVNKMTAHNLSVVFTPNLIRVDEPATTDYVQVPSNQQEAMASATLYLKQMNQGISLVEKLILNQCCCCK